MEEKTTQFYMAEVDSLVPYARNARTHSELQVDQIAASIKEFGFLSPIVVSADNTILCGHGRYFAAKKLGMEMVPCVKEEYLTETQKRAYILADNRIGLNAGWDHEMLAVEMEELKAADFDVSLTGFNDSEIADLFMDEAEPKEAENKEYEEEEFGDEEFEHECPRCGFRYN